ncbi:MAG: hypothetical protein FWE70_06955, partial [Oscillospiraceae bacterium]|nr:hypothetical protein [Oscillospiraceae bacterium]
MNRRLKGLLAAFASLALVCALALTSVTYAIAGRLADAGEQLSEAKGRDDRVKGELGKLRDSKDALLRQLEEGERERRRLEDSRAAREAEYGEIIGYLDELEYAIRVNELDLAQAEEEYGYMLSLLKARFLEMYQSSRTSLFQSVITSNSLTEA